jgi:hypothetical protein
LRASVGSTDAPNRVLDASVSSDRSAQNDSKMSGELVKMEVCGPVQIPSPGHGICDGALRLILEPRFVSSTSAQRSRFG